MKEVKLFLGPQHPGMHGNYSAHMYVEGDMINKSYALPGMLHRGFEKLMERRHWMGNLALIPRICVIEPDPNEMVYAMSIEKLAGIEVPERAHWIRMIILELARLAANLMAIGGIGAPVGLYTSTYWGVADRDLVLDIFEKITGARVYHMYIVPGGVRKDLPEGIEEEILGLLDYIEARLPEYYDLVMRSPIFQTRTKDNILLPEAVVWELGVTGIGMRSAVNKEYDIRKVKPYARYDQVAFSLPYGPYSDAFTRVDFKYVEMAQSISIIRQSIEKMPKEGPVRARIATGSALRWRVPPGMVYSCVESARGEYGYLVVSDGGEMPYRIAVRGSSYPQGLMGVEKYLPGHRIDDASLWMDTMGVCAPEIDR